MKSKKEVLEAIKALTDGVKVGLYGYENETKGQLRALLWAVDYQVPKPECISEEEWKYLTDPEPEDEKSPWERL